MPYTTVDQMIELYGHAEVLTLSGSETEEMDTARVEAAIVRATSEVDSYLGMRYGVPLLTVPPIISTLTADIARFRLTSGDVSEKTAIGERYRLAVDFLRNVASGAIRLGADAGASAGPRPVGVLIDPGERVWSCRV